MVTLNSMVTLNKHNIVDIDLSDSTLILEHNNLTFYYSITGLEDVKFFNDSYGVEGSGFVNDNIDEVVSYKLTEILDEEENEVDVNAISKDAVDNTKGISLDTESLNEELSEKLYELHLKQTQCWD